MSDKTTNTDHTETIEKARRLLTEVTPGRWEWGDTEETEEQGDPRENTQIAAGAVRVAYVSDVPGMGSNLTVNNPADADAIEAVPDLLEALDAVARERDELREQVRELEVKMYVSNLMTDARARKIALGEVIEWLKTNKDATP